MEIWIVQILPKSIIDLLPAITLIIVGLIVEKYYVGRISLLTNAVALSTFFSQFNNLNFWLIIYINVLTIAGGIALLSYTFKLKLTKHFYWIAGIFSSLISGLLLVYGFTLL